MKRCATVRDLSTSTARNGASKSRSTAALPSKVPDHLLVPMLIQRKSTDMRSISSVPFRFARPAKISSINFLFSDAPMMISVQQAVFAGSIAKALDGCPYPGCRKFSQRPLDQRRVAILPDLDDLAVRQPEHHAVFVVVADARLCQIIAARFNHDKVAIRNEAMRDRPRPLYQQRLKIALQVLEHRLLPLERMRPLVLSGHAPAHVVSETLDEQGAIAVGSAGVDLFHQLLVLGGARALYTISGWIGHRRRTYVILPIDSAYDIYSAYEFICARPQPSRRPRCLAAGCKCQPRRDADRPVAAGREPRAAAAARHARRSPAGSCRRANGTDAAGSGAARAAGAGARPGARTFHSGRFRCHAQRTALSPDDARSRGGTSGAAADGEDYRAGSQRSA